MTNWRQILSYRRPQEPAGNGYWLYFRGTTYATVWVEANSFEEAYSQREDVPIDDADPPENWKVYTIEGPNGEYRNYND
jgi:hypothetical protein